MPHQVLITLVSGYLLGILFGNQVFIIITAGLILILFLLIFKPIPLFLYMGFGFLFLALLGGMTYQTHLTTYTNDIPYSHLGETMSFSGKITEVIDQGENRERIVKIHILESSAERPFVARLDTWDSTLLQIGDHIEGDLRINDMDEVDYWLAQDNVHVSGALTSITSQLPSQGFNLSRNLVAMKNWIETRIRNFIGGQEADLMNGILLGTRSRFTEDFRNQMANSGTTHIVALSGFNTSLVIVFLVAVLAWLPKRIKLVLAGLAVLLFIIMTGLSSSVVRAAVMGWIVLLGELWGRRVHYGSVLLLAAAGMAIHNPFILGHDVGFQLSFVATAGLVFITPLLIPGLKRIIPAKLVGVGEATAATLAATISTLPLIAFYFGGISSVSFVANMAIIPLVPLVMVAGGLSFMISLLGTWTIPLSGILSLPAQALYSIIVFFGSLNYSYVQLPPLPALVVACWYSGIVLIIIRYAHLSPFSAKSHRTHLPTVR